MYGRTSCARPGLPFQGKVARPRAVTDEVFPVPRCVCCRRRRGPMWPPGRSPCDHTGPLAWDAPFSIFYRQTEAL